MTAALVAGGADHYGWGGDRHILANIFDALNLNTRASGNWGKKQPPKIPPLPRPTAPAKQAKTSVVDLFSRLRGSGRIVQRGGSNGR